MTETGLLNKVPYREAGSRERYEYVLTDKSRSLALVLFALMEWGHQHVLHSAPHIALVDSASGEAVHPGFITASGNCGEPRRPADRQGRRTLIAPLQNFRTPLAKAAASGYVA